MGKCYISITLARLGVSRPALLPSFILYKIKNLEDELGKSLMIFGLVMNDSNHVNELEPYETLLLPVTYRRGLLMRKDSPLAAEDIIDPDILSTVPILIPHKKGLRRSLGQLHKKLNIAATFNHFYSAVPMVEEGLGYALCVDGTIKLHEDSILCFKPIHPVDEYLFNVHVVWKKQAYPTKAAQKFLEHLQNVIN